MANGKRLLFFDLLRIVSVALIVFYHVAPRYGWSMPSNSAPLFNALYIYPGAIGVALLIFVSGAVLEYTHPRLESLAAVTGFYLKPQTPKNAPLWNTMKIPLP
jgi:peptidoglycan/LPS O-acetylase OafA/YrhL